ncbi:MAG: hypothetical protein UHU19_12675 [Lachnospiraceae bacterium]|nr:hypothetical protein [Lachnospiraceae bacterium]
MSILWKTSYHDESDDCSDCLIYGVGKYRRYRRPLLSAAKVISLASAMVSVLSLETAMLSAFGEAEQVEFRQIMTGCTGAGVCVFILLMAVYMILRAKIEISNIGEEGNEYD